MANRATFARGFMFKDVGATLGRVTAETTLVLGEHRTSAANVSGAFMRRVAVDATKSTLRDRMVTRQIVLSTHVRMTCVANCLFGTRRFDGDTRTVTGGLRSAGRKTV